ncbi:MAG: hypothetical protein HRU27_20920, partial [Rhizobiaceae bacterium]|nr:hypothetical protein [Rhizobiaceae bacterium]
ENSGTPITSRLLASIEEWKKFASKNTLKTIQGGLSLPWSGRRRPHNRNIQLVEQKDKKRHAESTTKQQAAMQIQIQEYIQQGTLVEVEKEVVQNYLQYFPVAKKGSEKVRVTTAFCSVNKATEDPPRLHLQNPSGVKDHIRARDWLYHIDLTDAFNHISIKEGDTYYLCIRFRGKSYRWKGAGFGLKQIPAVFCQILREALLQFRKKYPKARIVDYMDDLLLLCQDRQEGRRLTALLVQWLQKLGWLVNRPKSELEGKQVLQFLGFQWNTLLMQMELPQDKADKLLKTVKKLIHRNKWMLMEVQSVVGILQAYRPAIYNCRIHTRGLQSWLHNKTKYTSQKMDKTPEAQEDLKWWALEVKQGLTPQPFQDTSQEYSLVIEADASDTGWGAVNRNTGEEISGWFTVEEEHSLRIELKEILAAVTALEKWGVKLQDKTILLRTDSTVAMSYLQHLRGGRKQHLTAPLFRVWKKLRKRRVQVEVEWISTTDNWWADYLSRIERSRRDTICNPHLMAKMAQDLGMKAPQIDLFSNRHNSLCQQYNTWREEPGSHRTNTLKTTAQDYQGLTTMWGHPPWKLIPRVIQWLEREIMPEKKEILMCTPCWIGKTWHASLSSIAKAV